METSDRDSHDRVIAVLDSLRRRESNTLPKGPSSAPIAPANG